MTISPISFIFPINIQGNMKLRKEVIISILVVVLLMAFYLISPIFNVVEMQDEISSDVEIISQGIFMEQEHEVSGKALIVNDNENKILRFEDFETVNGPNLHIYLSADLEANDYIDLGEIKATKGDVNYELENSIDLEKYNKVLVWCVPFKVLFSYAELNS